MVRNNLVGRRFGKLIVVSHAGSKDQKNFWNCVCDCGGTKVLPTNRLTFGNTKSCGCARKDASDARRKTIEDFWARGKRVGGCLEWQGSLDTGGYGHVINIQFGDETKVHRIAYKLHYGVDPGDDLVRHTCHNRKCFEPTHLELGSHNENMLDMVISGNSNGCGKPVRKLTAEEAREIRKFYTTSNLSHLDIATKFEVSEGAVGDVVRNDTHFSQEWENIRKNLVRKVKRKPSKLTSEQIEEITRRYKSGETQIALSKEFKVSSAYISLVTSGKRRKS